MFERNSELNTQKCLCIISNQLNIRAESNFLGLIEIHRPNNFTRLTNYIIDIGLQPSIAMLLHIRWNCSQNKSRGSFANVD